jgi:hypothetical protein
LNTGSMSHTKARRHKVQAILRRIENFDPRFVPLCLCVSLFFGFRFAAVWKHWPAVAEMQEEACAVDIRL